MILPGGTMKKKIGENLMDQATMGVFSLLSGRLGKKTAEEQYTSNTLAWVERQPKSLDKKKKDTEEMPAYVEHQPELTWLKYGKANALEKKLFFGGRELTAAENACEVIATYNALLALELDRKRNGGKRRKHRSLPDLLYLFSKQGICAKGIFGTSPKALEKFFQRCNYRTASCRGKQITEEKLAELQTEYDVFIMTAFNEGQNPFSMVHTMCITKEKDGYQRHNDYSRVQYYPSLYEAVQDYHQGRAHTIYVLAVGNLKGQQEKV
jgi:hypothetical protein